MPKKVSQSKFLALSLILFFILLITTEAFPKKTNLNSDKNFRPVVKVKQVQEEVTESQKKLFERLIEEGKKLLQEEMDYEGAINKFNEAKALAVTKGQKTDALFHLSLAHYATLEEKGEEEFEATIRMLIEIDYFRKLDKLLCPPRYVELFQGIKEEYGALRIQSKPPGADVFINDSRDSVGKTPVTVGAKAGTIRIRVKKGNKEKRDTLRVVAGETTASPTYVLKGSSSLIYVIGGIVLAGGVGAALLGGGKGNGGGTPTPSPGPTTGSIQVNSTPTGAQVFLDGNDTGRTTNTTLTDVSPGSHTIKLVKEGYRDYEESISVTAGQTATINATLTEIIAGDYVFITKWGSQGAGDGQFNLIYGIAVDISGFVYVVDGNNNRIQKFTSDGTFVTKWGSNGNGDGQFSGPYNVYVSNSGDVYVSDSHNHRIQKFTSDGTFVAKWGSEGTGDGQFKVPRGIAIDAAGNVYVVDGDNCRIQKFTSDRTFVTKWGSFGNGDGQFELPMGIAIDSSGYIYVADCNNHRIQKFTSDGTFVAKWGGEAGGEAGQFGNPRDIDIDSSDYAYVAEGGGMRVQKLTTEGNFVTMWGSFGNGDGEFDHPTGIAVDTNGFVYVTEERNNRVQKFGPASAIQKISEITYPSSYNHSINRNFRPRPGLLNPPHRLELKQRLANSKIRKDEKKR